jgi:epoxide hydrolase-like predicted phosphatase
MTQIEAVISDFGGVLTSPLVDSFTAIQNDSGIPMAALGEAMMAMAEKTGANPLFELETGRMTEREFLSGLDHELSAKLGRDVHMHDFGERYFGYLEPNQRVIEYMRELRGRGYKMAICTNNVREWEHRWRAMLPVDEIFDVVVDSAFVGARKPEPKIFKVTLERLDVPAERSLLLDDIELNCNAARELGMHAVWFRSNDQAIEEIEEALAG